MTPLEIYHRMMEKDAMSQWLGVQLVEIKEGFCILEMTVSEEMLNGFQIAHGGITYSLSDSALAFASNAYGLQCVSIETSIHHLRPVAHLSKLRATCIEINRGRSIGLYEVKVTDEHNKLVSFFKGQVKIQQKEWK